MYFNYYTITHRKAIQYDKEDVALNPENVVSTSNCDTTWIITTILLTPGPVWSDIQVHLQTHDQLRTQLLGNCSDRTNCETNYNNASIALTDHFLQFEFCKFQEKDNLIAKVSDILSGVTASVVFEKLANFKNRSKWDFLCK